MPKHMEAFSVAADKLCMNSLPDVIRATDSLSIFKTKMKTFLFDI